VIPTPRLDSATTTTLFLMNVVSRYGVPAEVVCDNGSSFKDQFKEFCLRKGIHQRFITADVPRSNGLAERVVQTVKAALRKHAAQAGNALRWDTDGLSAILAGYRCTPHAATGHSPARIVFAVDPVLDASQYLPRMGVIDYASDDQPRLTDQLLQRAQLASELGIEVLHNLRTAHERDAQRFKAFRSGLYIPKVYHFHKGDHVFVLAQGQKPGGTLGIRARNEILTVKEVRPSGVLVLKNQAGVEFHKHMEHCVPCMLPNVLGDTYAGLVRPSVDHPCRICRDHRNWDLMLLCDNCDDGYHTFCLTPPLAAVPDGVWLCPDCLAHGMTPTLLQDKLTRLRHDKRSRPALELPARGRVAKHKALAEKWHGTIVRHGAETSARFGRVTVQSVLSPHWIHIGWQDGTTSVHNGHILPHLTILDAGAAPDSVPVAPAPITFFAGSTCSRPDNDTFAAAPFDWSLAAIADCVRRRMPGQHHTPEALHDAARCVRILLGCCNPQMPCRHMDRSLSRLFEQQLQVLCTVVDFTHVPQVVDLVSSNPLYAAELQQRADPAVLLCNHPCPGMKHAHTHLNPIDGQCFDYFDRAGGADVYTVRCAPALLDVVLPLAAERAVGAVFATVPETWLHNGPSARFHWLQRLVQDSRLLTVHLDIDGAGVHPMVWLCIFTSKTSRRRILCRPLSDSVTSMWVRCSPATSTLSTFSVA
jgi:PHD-finger